MEKNLLSPKLLSKHVWCNLCRKAYMLSDFDILSRHVNKSTYFQYVALEISCPKGHTFRIGKFSEEPCTVCGDLGLKICGYRLNPETQRMCHKTICKCGNIDTS